MAERKPIEIGKLDLGPIQGWNEWFLLGSGDYSSGTFNAMTVSWGSLGVMWGKPFAQVVVRPTRYTFEFMQKYDSFTLSRFPTECHRALALLGSKSGRDGDKISESELHPCAATTVQAPAFEEAELVIECRTIYRDDMNPEQFLVPEINDLYNNDFHRIYFGEIVALSGTTAFVQTE